VAQSLDRLHAATQQAHPVMATSAEAVADFADVVADWIDNPRDVWGIPTGLIELDELTGGLEREFVLVAGRPSHGKSALGLQLAYYMASHGHGVAFFSLEMSVQSLLMRLTCNLCKIDSNDLRRGRITSEQARQVYEAQAHLAELPIYWSYNASPTAAEIAAEVARLKLSHSVDVVVVDFIQLMATSERMENRNLEVGANARRLQQLSRAENVLLLAMSQLSRAVESRDVKIPQLSDLRDSGELEQAADKVLFVHREELVYRQRMESVPVDKQNRVTMILAKNRNGRAGVGTRQMLFFEKWGLFADPAEA